MEIRTKTLERLRDALQKSGKAEDNIHSSAYRTLVREGLLSDKENLAITRISAVAETMFLMMAADGHIQTGEMSALRGAIRGITGNALNDEIIQILLEKFARNLDEFGREARLRDLAQAVTDAREAESAFSLAAAVALADGAVDSSETQLLTELAAWLGFDDAKVKSIIDQVQDD